METYSPSPSPEVPKGAANHSAPPPGWGQSEPFLGGFLIGIQEKVFFPLGAELSDRGCKKEAWGAQGDEEACLKEWS